VYILAGEGVFSGDGQFHRLQAGDLIYIPSGFSHRHECPGPEVLRQFSLFVTPSKAGP
jgi:quercetin dioxygenase-like cupin family protein